MMAVSVVFTLATGEATTSWETSQGESLLRDGVTVAVFCTLSLAEEESSVLLPSSYNNI